MIRSVPNSGPITTRELVAAYLAWRPAIDINLPLYGDKHLRLQYWEKMIHDPATFRDVHPSARPSKFMYITRRIQEIHDPAQRRARIKRMIAAEGPKAFTEPWWPCWE